MAAGRGSEDQFKEIVEMLAANCKKYEAAQIKYYQFVDAMDNIFILYGWSKEEFYKELNVRSGIHNNVEYPLVKKPKAKSSKSSK
jgi:hypothetical protein